MHLTGANSMHYKNIRAGDVISFDGHFRDRMGEVERGHIEVFPKLWNLRPYIKRNNRLQEFLV